MKRLFFIWTFLAVILLPSFTQGFVVDHLCTDISKIPYSYIDKIKHSSTVFHYATRSHGQRITAGLEELDNTSDTLYPVVMREQNMPDLLTKGLKMYINMPNNNYVTPDAYWDSQTGIADLSVLFQNTNIKYSLWVFCGELTDENSGPNNIVYRYLDSINSLEQRFPAVKFIYTTSHSQSFGLQCWQYKARDSANRIIRNYCYENNKILFDFGDIECWENGVEDIDTCIDWTQTNLLYQAQLPRFRVDGPGHTTMENAVQYGKAFWWLLAQLNGWDGGAGSVDTEAPTVPSNLRSSNISDVSCTLSWDASTDNVNVTGYQVYRGTTLIGTPRSSPFGVTGLFPNTNYAFTVYARDYAGNLSTVSNQINITTLNQLPTVNLARGKTITASSTENQYFPGSFANDGNIDTRWSSAYADPQWISIDLGMVYSISRVVLVWENTENYGRSYQIQGSTNGTDWSDMYATTAGIGGTENLVGLSGVGRYIRFYGTQRSLPYGFSLREIEVYGIVGNGTADTEAPSAPTNLLASSVSSTTVNLTWNASTDNIGVSNYSVYRDGNLVGTTSNTSLYVPGLASATTYSLTVLATDVAGNNSLMSAAINVTTLNADISLNDFITGTYGGIVYRLYVPKGYNPSVSYPMVVFLHGAGERGSNNTSQMTEWPLLFAQDSNQTRWPSFVLAPQCPYDQQWVNTPWSNGSYSTDNVPMSSALTAVNDIIAQIQSDYNVNSRKLYVTGLSMGGYGTWDFITRYPSKFAAAVPICGGGDPSKAAAIKDIPLRFYHSSDDGVVPVSGSRDMNTALLSASAVDAVYKEYTNLDHISWPTAYKEPGLLPWMFGQTKKVDLSQGFCIDHTCTDISKIPASYIQKVKLTSDVIHYATRYHGTQIIDGLTYLDTAAVHDTLYPYNRGNQQMPNTTVSGLKMYQNMPLSNYVAAGDYWYSALGVSELKNLLQQNPSIKYTTWMWSTEHIDQWPGPDNLVHVYLDSIHSLEQQFPDVKFIYTTSTAQSNTTDLDCWQYYARDSANKIIRDYCKQNNKILYDFADIETWDNGVLDMDTCTQGETTFIYRAQIPAFRVNGPGHTSLENCILKAKAFWWMMARFQGWDGEAGSVADVISPSTPIQLRTTSISSTGCNLVWNASTDNIGVTGYNIYRGASFIGTTTATIFNVSGLSPNQTYSFTVYAKDAAGNVSAASSALSVTTINSTDVTAPSAPTGLVSTVITTASFTLSWNASTDNVGVVSYEVFRGTTSCGTTASNTLSVTGLAAATAYSITVKAKDAAGNVSAASSVLSVTTLAVADLIAPTAPTGLTSSAITTTSFTLSWIASTDNVGVVSYEVFRGIVSCGTTATTSLSITGLTPETTYSMTVKARDASGNISVSSSPLSVITFSSGDTQAPTVPSALMASELTTNSFTISWTPSTDNIGVVSYEIFIDGISLGISSALSYSITGLVSDKRYVVTLKARDAAGNISQASNALSVTTLKAISLDANSDDVVLFPNPTTNYVMVKGIQSRALIIIYDMNGVMIHSAYYSENSILYVSHLSAGTYMISVSENTTTKYFKLTKN